jgi:tRNA1Val (adenine37-N6)-methyltransferase
MKLSTDAVLIGSVVSLENPTKILDIGTGSGIIALMLAQRSKAIITGIDPDKGSIKDAQFNVENSPWENRLKVLETDLETFASTTKDKFDLIVSNPPFFLNSQSSPAEKHNIARHQKDDFFGILLQNTVMLMAEKARCCFIVAGSSFELLHKTAVGNGLSMHRKICIFPKPSKSLNRIIAEYSLEQSADPINEELIIRNENNSFTEQYRSLTRNFYLGL